MSVFPVWGNLGIETGFKTRLGHMLEAVNSVLQSAPLVRAQAEQVSTADSFAANPDRVQKAPPKAPYISPYIHFDVNFDEAVLQIRDSSTGDVLRQFPSEPILQNRQRQAARAEAASQESASKAASTASPSSSSPSSFEAQTVTPDVYQAAPAPAKQAKSVPPQQLAAFDAASRSGSPKTASVAVFA